jgi:hypothetical protein
VGYGTAGRLAAAVLVGLVILVGGCGGGDDGNDSSTPADSGATRNAPESAETAQQFGDKLTSAVQAARSGDCSQLEEINSLSRRVFQCSQLKGDGWSDFAITGVADFGTGGVVDYANRETPHGMILIGLDRSGQHGIIFAGDAGGPTVGTAPVGVAAQDQAVQRLLDAYRTQNCDQFAEAALTEASKAQECSEAFKSDLPTELKADPSAKAERFGGTSKAGFYGLSTGDDGYRTLVTLPSGGPDDWVVDSYNATG